MSTIPNMAHLHLYVLSTSDFSEVKSGQLTQTFDKVRLPWSFIVC